LLLRSAETNPLMPRFVPFRNLLPLCVQASARAMAVEVELWETGNGNAWLSSVDQFVGS